MIGVFWSVLQSEHRARRSMLLEDLYLLAARHLYVPDWDWSEGEEWQYMGHRSSSLEDNLRRVPIFWIREWATQGRRGDWGRSWLLIYRHTERGQLCGAGSGAEKKSLSNGLA